MCWIILGTQLSWFSLLVHDTSFCLDSICPSCRMIFSRFFILLCINLMHVDTKSQPIWNEPVCVFICVNLGLFVVLMGAYLQYECIKVKIARLQVQMSASSLFSPINQRNSGIILILHSIQWLMQFLVFGALKIKIPSFAEFLFWIFHQNTLYTIVLLQTFFSERSLTTTLSYFFRPLRPNLTLLFLQIHLEYSQIT